MACYYQVLLSKNPQAKYELMGYAFGEEQNIIKTYQAAGNVKLFKIWTINEDGVRAKQKYVEHLTIKNPWSFRDVVFVRRKIMILH